MGVAVVSPRGALAPVTHVRRSRPAGAAPPCGLRASALSQRERGPLPLSLGEAARRAGQVLRAVWKPLLAHALLVGAAALIMYPALAAGELRWQDDNKYFYFPFLSRTAAALREGRLPLWEPGIFSGYPLFADGETGMLYPPNLIALRLLEPAAALAALRLLRFYLAGAFTYAYLRAVGCTRA